MRCGGCGRNITYTKNFLVKIFFIGHTSARYNSKYYFTGRKRMKRSLLILSLCVASLISTAHASWGRARTQESETPEKPKIKLPTTYTKSDVRELEKKARAAGYEEGKEVGQQEAQEQYLEQREIREDEARLVGYQTGKADGESIAADELENVKNSGREEGHEQGVSDARWDWRAWAWTVCPIFVVGLLASPKK
jgi:hypothetical protein